jgi:hypothetical protein
MASSSRRISRKQTCFFHNLLHQPEIAMANRLIRIEDIASIAHATVAAEDALLATLDNTAAAAHTAMAAEEVRLASPETNVTTYHDEQGNRVVGRW